MIPFQKKRVERKQHGSFEVDVPGAEIELAFFSRILQGFLAVFTLLRETGGKVRAATELFL